MGSGPEGLTLRDNWGKVNIIKLFYSKLCMCCYLLFIGGKQSKIEENLANLNIIEVDSGENGKHFRESSSPSVFLLLTA